MALAREYTRNRGRALGPSLLRWRPGAGGSGPHSGPGTQAAVLDSGGGASTSCPGQESPEVLAEAETERPQWYAQDLSQRKKEIRQEGKEALSLTTHSISAPDCIDGSPRS